MVHPLSKDFPNLPKRDIDEEGFEGDRVISRPVKCTFGDDQKKYFNINETHAKIITYYIDYAKKNSILRFLFRIADIFMQLKLYKFDQTKNQKYQEYMVYRKFVAGNALASLTIEKDIRAKIDSKIADMEAAIKRARTAKERKELKQKLKEFKGNLGPINEERTKDTNFRKWCIESMKEASQESLEECLKSALDQTDHTALKNILEEFYPETGYESDEEEIAELKAAFLKKFEEHEFTKEKRRIEKEEVIKKAFLTSISKVQETIEAFKDPDPNKAPPYNEARVQIQKIASAYPFIKLNKDFARFTDKVVYYKQNAILHQFLIDEKILPEKPPENEENQDKVKPLVIDDRVENVTNDLDPKNVQEKGAPLVAPPASPVPAVQPDKVETPNPKILPQEQPVENDRGDDAEKKPGDVLPIEKPNPPPIVNNDLEPGEKKAEKSGVLNDFFKWLKGDQAKPAVKPPASEEKPPVNQVEKKVDKDQAVVPSQDAPTAPVAAKPVEVAKTPQEQPKKLEEPPKKLEEPAKAAVPVAVVSQEPKPENAKAEIKDIKNQTPVVVDAAAKKEPEQPIKAEAEKKKDDQKKPAAEEPKPVDNKEPQPAVVKNGEDEPVVVPVKPILPTKDEIDAKQKQLKDEQRLLREKPLSLAQEEILKKLTARSKSESEMVQNLINFLKLTDEEFNNSIHNKTAKELGHELNIISKYVKFLLDIRTSKDFEKKLRNLKIVISSDDTKALQGKVGVLTFRSGEIEILKKAVELEQKKTSSSVT